MPALCLVLSRDNLENSDVFLVRMLKSFRRPRCMAEVARKANVFGTFECNENISVSHLSLQQQDKLRRKTHSHARHNKCRCPHWPPHCSRILQRYPSVKRQLLSGGSIVLINIPVERPCWTFQCDFDSFLRAMEHLQTIVSVLRAVQQRKGTSNLCSYFIIDPRGEIDADWWFSLARLSKDWACLSRACSVYYAPNVKLQFFNYVHITSDANNWVSELHGIFSTFTRDKIERCCFQWSSNLTSYIFRFVCVGWLDTLMWHACNRRFVVGDRVLYEHLPRDITVYSFAPAVVSTVTSDFICLTLDTDHSIYNSYHVTLQGDFRCCKPMRRFLFDGDVVSFSEQNVVLFGVVRREATEAIYLQSYRMGFREVRVQLLHQSGYVYRSVGEVHFPFKVRTGTLIPGSPFAPYFPR